MKGWSGAIGAMGFILLGQTGAIAQPSTPETHLCPAQLADTLDGIMAQSPLERTRWGMIVQELGHETTLYDRESDRFFIPASNAKLLTMAAVLTQLGPEFQIQTSVVQTVPDPTATGSEIVLHVMGRGDPSLSPAGLADLVQQLHAQGITHVDQLVAEDGYFGDPAIHPNWEWEDIQAGYGAPSNGLMLNQNALAYTLTPQRRGEPLRFQWADAGEARYWQIDNQTLTVAPSEPEFITVEQAVNRPVLHVRGQLQVGAAADEGAIAILDPASYFVRQFRQQLLNAGITVSQTRITPENQSVNGVAIAAITSPPLADLLLEANQHSSNSYAESLLRTLGRITSPQAESALDAGLTATEDILSGFGVDPNSIDLVDGSGLSRHNLVTPQAIAQTLQSMARSPFASAYRRSLAVAGVSGTLRHRFVNTPVAGQLWGKTGAMSGIAALSGYLDPPNYEPLVFSILVNHFEQPVRTIRPIMDDLVQHLAQLQHC